MKPIHLYHAILTYQVFSIYSLHSATLVKVQVSLSEGVTMPSKNIN